MYVNPFWLGVLVTILVEVVFVILMGLFHPRDGEGEESDDRTSKGP